MFHVVVPKNKEVNNLIFNILYFQGSGDKNQHDSYVYNFTADIEYTNKDTTSEYKPTKDITPEYKATKETNSVTTINQYSGKENNAYEKPLGKFIVTAFFLQFI